jgi:hypothetical protein
VTLITEISTPRRKGAEARRGGLFFPEGFARSSSAPEFDSSVAAYLLKKKGYFSYKL